MKRLRWIGKKNRKPMKYCGLTVEQMEAVLYKLCDLEDDHDLNEREQAAMDIAIQAVSDLRNAMLMDGRIHWEWSE